MGRGPLVLADSKRGRQNGSYFRNGCGQGHQTRQASEGGEKAQMTLERLEQRIAARKRLNLLLDMKRRHDTDLFDDAIEELTQELRRREGFE